MTHLNLAMRRALILERRARPHLSHLPDEMPDVVRDLQKAGLVRGGRLTPEGARVATALAEGRKP